MNINTAVIAAVLQAIGITLTAVVATLAFGVLGLVGALGALLYLVGDALA
jgi:hypothetical protein